MNVKKTMVSLSFAAVLTLICSFLVLPTQATNYSCTRQMKNVLGWVLCEYTLYERATTDGTSVTWYGTPTGDPNCYLGWSEGTPAQSVIYASSSVVIVQGHCYFWFLIDHITLYCQISIYGDGSAEYSTWAQ